MKITRQVVRESLRSWFAPDLQRVGPWWLQLVWTQIFCMTVAAGFTMLGFALYASGDGAWRNWSAWLYWYGKNLFVSMTIGFLIHLLFEVFGRLLGAERLRTLTTPQRGLFFAGIPMLGVVIGWPFSLWVQGAQGVFNLEDPNAIVGSLLVSLLLCSAFYVYFDARARQIMAEQRATEAQLRLLQAQIEPHFLFNTLANVQSLIDPAPAQAKRLLEDFTDYLRASLTSLRGDDAPLAQELALARTFLRLMQGRMGERLHFSIEADPALADLPLPPLLLQPLIENALTHGLEPQVDGGTVQVTARVDGQRVVLTVRDDGRGLDAPPRRGAPAGTGVALQNIRERLRSRYGDGAALTLSPGEPGTVATITLPLHAARAAAAPALGATATPR